MTDDTPWEPPLDGSEAEHLVGALDRLRWTFRYKADGLDRAGLGARIGASTLTLGGLLKHLAACEDQTSGSKLLGEPLGEPWTSWGWDGSNDWELSSAATDEPALLYRTYDDAVERARERFRRALADGGPGTAAALTTDDGGRVSLRRLLCDLLEEYGRHTGHADLLREAVDGRVGEDPPPGWRPVGAVASPAPGPASAPEIADRDLRGRRLRHVDLSGASVAQSDLAGVRLRDVHLSDVDVREAYARGLRLRGVELLDARLDGEITGLVVNGVDVTGYVERLLDEREPDRALMRATTVDELRQAWEVVEQRWATTVERARSLDPALLHAQVDDEWSFVQTLRHLVFATDCWVGRMIGQDPAPWHPLALPWDSAPEVDGVPSDRDARLDLEPVLAARRDRMDQVVAVLTGLSDDDLVREVTAPDQPGHPSPGTVETVGQCLRVVLNEEWLHRQFAERDLDVLTAPS